MTDLNESIEIGLEAVNATPPAHPGRGERLANLGSRFEDRHLRTGAVFDIEKAVQLTREASQVSQPHHRNHSECLVTFGAVLHTMYKHTGKITDLEEAIRVSQEALVEATFESDPRFPSRLSMLGNLLQMRFSALGEATDIEGAIRAQRDAVGRSPQDDADHPGYLSNLAICLSGRYSMTRNKDDLDECVRLSQESVDATPRVHADWAIRSSNLGDWLYERYSRIGRVVDLDEAIRIGSEVSNATPTNHPNRSVYLNNLAIRLSDRYSRTGVVDDHDEAIRIAQESVDATPKDDADRIGRLLNLGGRLCERYRRTELDSDFKTAFDVGKQALDASPTGHALRMACLNNLGALMVQKHKMKSSMADLDEAIRYCRESVDATSHNHPDRAGRLSNLGAILAERFIFTKEPTALNEVFSCFQAAIELPSSPLIIRIHASRELIFWLAVGSKWQQAFEAADAAIRLIPQLVLRSLDTSDKQHLISQVAGLACEAASAALGSGQRPEVALSFLEQGRGVLATSIQDVRADVLELRDKHPELAEKFTNVREELEQSNTRKPTDTNQQSSGPDLDKYFDEILGQIRESPGFEEFLMAPSASRMQEAAGLGPIVVINVSVLRCDAIIVEQHQIRYVPLPKLSGREIRDKAQTSLGGTQTLEWLWDVVVHPILISLGFTKPPVNAEWPHIWWIPTGALCKFPLHAAGYHLRNSSETVLDRVVSSYSSSIRAMILGRRQTSVSVSSQAMALLVAMEDTPGSAHLQFARQEVEQVRKLCVTMNLTTVEPKRRKQEILSYLNDCRIFHFAGHGYTNENDPSNSYLLLEEGRNEPLTVANLLELNLHKHSPFLAYLSACGTGRIKNDKFVDESIHLIGACQVAGFRHVIGTLWEVYDEQCVDTAVSIYKEMRRGNMTDISVCIGLHTAVRNLRDRWLCTAREEKLQRSPGELTTTRSVSREDSKDDRLLRDVKLVDDSEVLRPLYWVPYIHFGV
ncbi:CHAT domain-containing protein [Ilyonectria robusta]|uniref:CHAT domain-containing protein n=1 Tax=Ilyonectria robusta TaxID=1079257 RepID=UPI001E8CAEFC|nr:CHAT domain-containing protein [Ilyonectria robusta]KAH8736878.1 CHAT domain-containing protein [Ilyonectria robusta]